MRLLKVTMILFFFSFSGLCAMQSQPLFVLNGFIARFSGVKKLPDKELFRLEKICRNAAEDEMELLFACLAEQVWRRERKKEALENRKDSFLVCLGEKSRRKIRENIF